MNVTIIHYNPDFKKSHECTYEYPLDEDLHVVRLSMEINDQYIDAKVFK